MSRSWDARKLRESQKDEPLIGPNSIDRPGKSCQIRLRHVAYQPASLNKTLLSVVKLSKPDAIFQKTFGMASCHFTRFSIVELMAFDETSNVSQVSASYGVV